MSNGVSDAVIRLNLTWARLLLSVVVLVMTVVGSSYAAVRHAISNVAEEEVAAQIKLLESNHAPEGFVRRHELDKAVTVSDSQYESLSRKVESNSEKLDQIYQHLLDNR